MNRRKMNISLCSLGLALLLTVAALVSAAGTTLARYRAEATEPITFTARPAGQIRLGQLVTGEDGGVAFVPDAQGAWEPEDGRYRLTFAVSNLITGETFAADDQQVYLRLVGTPGIWDGAETVKITLLMPAAAATEAETQTPENTETAEDPEESTAPEANYDAFQAVATRIGVDSPLYNTFGDGWVFSFLNEDGMERSWTLEGGTLSVLEMTLTLEGTALTDPSLLQLQITGD